MNTMFVTVVGHVYAIIQSKYSIEIGLGIPHMADTDLLIDKDSSIKAWFQKIVWYLWWQTMRANRCFHYK